MDSFFDNLIEKCAGRSASDRLHQRLIEQQLNQAIASLNPVSGIAEPSVDSEQPETAIAQEVSARSTATLEPAKDCVFVRPLLPPRSKSYITESTRRPRFRREDRSCVTHDCLLPDEEYPNWYPPERPSSSSTETTNSSTRSVGPSSVSGPDSGRSASCAPLLYPVPKLPEMIGYGRFRRSKTATDEWFKENLAKELRALSPLVSDGFFVRGPPVHPFQSRKESDASTISSTYGQPVVSKDGSIIVRGFVSASSSVATSGTLENRTQESSWRSDLGDRDTASPNIGHECSCPGLSVDDCIHSNGIASPSDYITEIHQSRTEMKPPQCSDGSLSTVADSSTGQRPQRADLGVEEDQIVACHPVDGLQIERLSMADRGKSATGQEGDDNSKGVSGHRAGKAKRNHMSKARLVRRLTGSKGARKAVKSRAGEANQL
ncbi:MAG: hypothetical protein M1839_001085 [Geoglossum umbratile]|nr:MAG: hypothetical protein M1839_001085 [Geoglossum umbratile]